MRNKPLSIDTKGAACGAIILEYDGVSTIASPRPESEGDDPDWIDNMLLEEIASEHRTKNVVPFFPACVARPVPKNEMLANKKAMKAFDDRRISNWASASVSVDVQDGVSSVFAI